MDGVGTYHSRSPRSLCPRPFQALSQVLHMRIPGPGAVGTGGESHVPW